MAAQHSLLLSIAPNGAYKTKQQHENIPLTPDELAAEAVRCTAQSAALFHLHIRDENAAHSLSPSIYREATSKIREKVGENLIIQITTESCNRYHYTEQFSCVYEVEPEAFSVALREALAEAEAKQPFKELLSWSAKKNIVPQYILYTPSEIKILAELMAEKIIPASRPFILFVVGKKNPDVKEVFTLNDFVNTLHDYFPVHTPRWAVCGFGIDEHRVVDEAIALNGHIRIGFENNLHLRDGSLASTNASLIEELKKQHSQLGFLSAEKARIWLQTA